MSVPKNKRTKSPLTAIVKLHDLHTLTMLLLNDEKCMPKSLRWLHGASICNSVNVALTSAIKANSIRVTDTESALARRAYQRKAIHMLLDLGVYMRSYYDMKKFKKRKFNRWRLAYTDASDLIQRWKSADDDRYRDFRKNPKLIKSLEDRVLDPVENDDWDIELNEYFFDQVLFRTSESDKKPDESEEPELIFDAKGLVKK